jgi:Zinc dependent phospholipase C
LYDPPVLLLVGLAAVFVLAWPNDALAWGPVTHLVHGSQVLDSLSILAPALQEILREHRLPYLYGCVAADIVQAKKYTRSLYTHCHCWPVGWQIVDAAKGEREEAFAYGYLSHLAADVYSHNHFVPVQLVTSFEARTLRHLYWEARFDAAQDRDRWRLLRQVVSHRYRDLDRLVERVVERTLFSFRTNKRIFDSLMALQQLEQWQTMVRGLGHRSRYPLPQAEVDRFNALCTGAIQDLLLHGHESGCQDADPTGREALAQAGALRRKLRALKRMGEVPDAIAAELRALRSSAA